MRDKGYTTFEGRELYFPCTVCGKQYESKKALALHERTLHEGKPKKRQEYNCKFCGRQFRNYRAYTNHLAKIHGAERENKFKRFLKPAKNTVKNLPVQGSEADMLQAAKVPMLQGQSDPKMLMQ